MPIEIWESHDGRGEDSIAKEYGLSKAEARALMDRWFAPMPNVRKYVDSRRELPRQGVFPTTPFKRKRRFGIITDKNLNGLQNECVNFPIQSTASDLNLLSAFEINDWLRSRNYAEEDIANIFNLVHDSIVLEVKEEYVEEVAAFVKFAMETVPGKYLNTDMPFKADIEIGDHYGGVKEVDMSDTSFMWEEDLIEVTEQVQYSEQEIC